MRYQNPKFRYVIIGDLIKCKPDIYDRDLTPCRVIKKTSTTLRNGYERLELVVRVLDRKNYEPLILDQDDTDL